MLIVELFTRLDFNQDGRQYPPYVDYVFVSRLVGGSYDVLCSLRDGQSEVRWSELHCFFLVFNQAAMQKSTIVRW